MMRPPTTPQQRPGVWLHQPLAGSSIQTPEEDYSVSLEEFKRIGALNMLEFDDRPSFVIDLLSKSFRSKVLIPLHINPALRAEDVSLALLLGTATENDGLKGLPTFWEWTASWTEQEDGRKTSVPLYGWYWAAIVLDGRWGIFQAVKRVAAKKSSSLNPNDLRTMAAGDCMPSATQRLASSNENLGMGDSTSSLNASLTSTWTAPEYQTSEVDPQLRLDGQEEWNLGRRPKNTLPSGSPSLPILSQEPSSSRHRRVASGEYRDGTQKDNRRNRSSSRDAEPRLQSPTRHEISRLDGRDGKLARPRRTQKGIPPRNSSKGFSSQETSETAPIPLPNDPLTEITHQSKALPVKPLQRNDKNHIEGGDSKDSKDIKDGKEKGNTKKPLLDRGPEVRVLYTDSMDGNEIDAIVFSRHDRYLTDKHIDWLIDDLAPCPNKYAQFLREYDWASTPLGPIKDWSFQLRSLVHTMVTDPEPAAILWGTNLSLIYNEGCVQVIGRKHPGGLGTSMASVFGELWQHISPMAKSASEGKPAGMKDLSLPMMRYGFLEETYWSFMMLPIIGPTGKTIGIYDRFSEVTKRVLTDRRMELIISLSDCGSEARDLDDLWDLMLKTIEISDHSKPYGIIYTVSPATPNAEGTLKNSQPLPSPSIKACVLAKTFGIRPDTLPQSLDLYDCQTPLEKAFIEAWGSNSPVFLRFIDGALPDFLAVSVDDRGHGDACKIVAIMPVRCGHEKGLVAFLVLGLNPRRPFEEYPEFIRLLHRRLIDAASSVFLPLEERRNQA